MYVIDVCCIISIGTIVRTCSVVSMFTGVVGIANVVETGVVIVVSVNIAIVDFTGSSSITVHLMAITGRVVVVIAVLVSNLGRYTASQRCWYLKYLLLQFLFARNHIRKTQSCSITILFWTQLAVVIATGRLSW